MLTADLFFQELQKLIDSRPRFPTQVLHSDDCLWGNNLYFCKNTFPLDKILALVKGLEKRYPLTQANENFNKNTTFGN